MKIKLNNLMFDRLIEAQEWMHDNDCAHTYATIQENNIPPGLLSQPDWATGVQLSRLFVRFILEDR